MENKMRPTLMLFHHHSERTSMENKVRPTLMLFHHRNERMSMKKRKAQKTILYLLWTDERGETDEDEADGPSHCMRTATTD